MVVQRAQHLQEVLHQSTHCCLQCRVAGAPTEDRFSILCSCFWFHVPLCSQQLWAETQRTTRQHLGCSPALTQSSEALLQLGLHSSFRLHSAVPQLPTLPLTADTSKPLALLSPTSHLTPQIRHCSPLPSYTSCLGVPLHSASAQSFSYRHLLCPSFMPHTVKLFNIPGPLQ